MRNTIIIFFLLIGANSVEAQTITLGPIAKYAYCVGDTLIVPYQAGGSFDADNSFTLQISGAKGSFSTFTNFGHDSAATGEFHFPLVDAGDYYRFRVASSDPYVFSTPTDSDVISSEYPMPEPVEGIELLHPPIEPAGLINSPIAMKDWIGEPAGSSFLWTFGQDANISSSTDSTPSVSFPTEGAKDVSLTVTNAGGCSSKVDFHIHVFQCYPTIPAGPRIVPGPDTGSDAFVWVKAGGAYTTSGSGQTVFVEPGGSVNVGCDCVGTFYLRNGSSFSTAGSASSSDLILDTGISISYSWNPYILPLHCDGLAFDYSLVGTAHCTPVLPSTVHIVTDTEQGKDSAVWIKAGGNYTAIADTGNPQTIFVEDGGALTAAHSPEGTYYLKAGASFSNHGINGDLNIIMSPGQAIKFNPANQQVDTLTCAQLVFDYSQIPSSVEESPAPTVSLIQSGDHLYANTEETPAEIRILNILGAEVLSQNGVGALDVDLAPLPAGVYFAVVQSGDAWEVRKIAVVH